MDNRLLLILALPLFWYFLLVVISKMGGWSKLALHYETHQIPDGQKMNFHSAIINGAKYNGVINYTFRFDGLGLEVFLLFRAGHPRVFIPWTDLEYLGQKKQFWVSMHSIGIRKAGVEIFIGDTIWEQVQKYIHKS